MEKLPTEVISNIASNLEKGNIRECMKVCRSWYSRMSPIYYQKLNYFFSEKTLLTRTEMTRIDGKRIGDFTRLLHFNQVYDMQKADFCRLIYNLPLLHTIKFTGADKCVDYLNTVPLTQLQNVQEITANTIDKEVQKAVLSINLKLKGNITRMFLNNVDADIVLNGYSNLFSALSAFTRLTELNVYVREAEEPLYLQRVLNSCINLETLLFKSERGFSLTEGGSRGTHRNLKKLTLDALNGLPLENLDYITEYLPNLKELALDYFRQQDDVSVLDLRSQRFKKFAQYLKALLKFSFTEWRTYRENTPTYSIQDERFWSYIREIVVAEQYSCNLNIRVSKFEEFRGIGITVNTIEKVIDIGNSWIGNSDTSYEPWIHHINFMNLKSATVSQISSSVDFEIVRGILVKPLVQVLKQQRKKHHHSTVLRVEKMFRGIIATMTFRFVDSESYEYRVQKESRHNNRDERSGEVLNLVDDLRPILGGRMLDVTDSPSPYQIDYLVEVNDTE